MMFRETPGGVIAISQPSHAWLSGQIIRAWGNAEFGPVTPYEDVCLGAEQHDIGWLTWEQAPTLNAATGRPHSFREVPVAVHTGIWRRGTEMAAVFGRYPALLASLHGTGLYSNFDFAVATDADGTVVRDFLSGQHVIQSQLLGSLSADVVLGEFSTPAMVERNRGLVRTADRISIAICAAMGDLAVRTDNPHEGIVRRVPTADGETEIHLFLMDGDPSRIAVTPWPFASSGLRVTCEGVLLPSTRFADETDLRKGLRSAETIIISAELTSI
jgi:hypothetical protein